MSESNSPIPKNGMKNLTKLSPAGINKVERDKSKTIISIL